MTVTAPARRKRSLRIATPVAEPPPRLAKSELERCTAQDRFHDYILSEYEPIAPAVGKLRSLNLLVESFALMGVESQGRAVIDALRTGLGPFRTVWGIKRHRDREELGWELYFYDFDRSHADLSIPHVTELLAPHVHVEGREPRSLPWHMFSVELGREQLLERAPAAVDIYFDMRSYKARGDQLVFENIYTFHDARAEIRDVLHRLRACVHFDARTDRVSRLMPPHLFDCWRICVANKRAADALYFSRIATPSLARFLGEQSWPAALTTWVRGREAELNHLQWCVGLDFRGVDGRATTVKSGVYGTF